MESFMQTGVYFHLSGPSYETAAECQMIRSWGGDSVGMSTAPEVVVARHCGMKVLGTQIICKLARISKEFHKLTTFAKPSIIRHTNDKATDNQVCFYWHHFCEEIMALSQFQCMPSAWVFANRITNFINFIIS